MQEHTLESLAARIAALEQMVLKPGQVIPPVSDKDWRSAVGMFANSEFMREVVAAGQAIREQERREAAQEDEP